MPGSKGITYAALASDILVDIAGLYLGYLLLQCRNIQKVFVYIFFIVLVTDLIFNIYNIIKGPLQSRRNDNNYSPDSGKQLTDTEVGVVIGVVLFALVLLVIKLVFFIYIMYKLYTCSSVPRGLFFAFIALIIIESVLYTLANKDKFKKNQQTTTSIM